jgi:predicted nucleic acid-binding protein
MKAISNSSILIALSGIGRLELLLQRFPEGVIVPEAVWIEVVETGHGRTGAEKVASAGWISRRRIRNRAFVTTLQTFLDQGEAEVIALGQEIGADLLLLDEKGARNVAARLKYPVLGTVGLLVWARRQGLFLSLAKELTLLRLEGGFHLSKTVYDYALQQVGE